MDAKKPEVIIQCGSCDNLLWYFKILATQNDGKDPLSHGTKPFSKNVPSFASQNYKAVDANMRCPLCGGQIPVLRDNGFKLKMVDPIEKKPLLV